MPEQEQLQIILDRISALEAANQNPEQPDYEDPPLILVNRNNTPVDPESIEKIPDLVKDLPIFTGEPSELHVWIDDAEKLVNLYKPNVNSSVDKKNKFHMVCRTIRRKIRGEANSALVASNVNLNWLMIKSTLLTYYGEKRDLNTLDCQLMNVQQKNRNLEEYYNEVNKILSLIANHIKNDDRYNHPEASKSLIEMYNEKAIDAFVRGLDGDIGKFLKNYRAVSLAQAYGYCVSFMNTEYRKNYSKLKPEFPTFTQQPQKIPPKLPPRIPPQHSFNIRQPMVPPFKTFQSIPQFQRFQPMQQFPRVPQQLPTRFQQGMVTPQPLSRMQQIPQAKPQQVFQPNPFQPKFEKPVPMEVDPSIRTNRVNYVNRPKNFNIESENTEEYIQQLPVLANEEYPEGPSFERYFENLEYQYTEDEQSVEDEAELNFLG